MESERDRERDSKTEEEGDMQREKRENTESTFSYRRTIYILRLYYVNLEWPLQIILLHR